MGLIGCLIREANGVDRFFDSTASAWGASSASVSVFLIRRTLRGGPPQIKKTYVPPESKNRCRTGGHPPAEAVAELVESQNRCRGGGIPLTPPHIKYQKLSFSLTTTWHAQNLNEKNHT